MERSRKIFLDISSASHKVNIAANKYADHKGFPGVQRSHFQLEADMRRISVACETLAGILSGSGSLPGGPAPDVRVQDWLSSDEPRVCLDTLNRMERLLRKDTISWKTIFPRRRGTTSTQDKIKEAVDLLGSSKGCFHFLFTTETWNNEGGAQEQKDPAQSLDHIQEGSDILNQTLPVVALTSIVNTSVPDAAIHQRDRAVTEMKYERVVDTQRGKEKYGDYFFAQNFEDILKWLDGLNCAEKQDITLLLRQPDTCRWLFDTMQYKAWRDGECSCLWLRGKPGAGKSVLVSSVVDSLEGIRRAGGILAYFYCDFRNERSTSASEALRSILSQLLHQIRETDIDPESLIDDLVDAKKRGGATRTNIKELAEFACRTAKLFMKKPLVVVDALDECKDIERLLEGLNLLKGYVQLFMTSRPLLVIKDGLSGIPFISMDDMAEKLSVDIALHVSRELDARRRLRVLDPVIKVKIHSVLCHKADGMFRWVQCSIDTLNRCVTLKELSEALADLPEGLDETYERILLAIDTETREGQLAMRALVWLVAALRPLQIDELMEGLSIDLEKRTLDFSVGPMHRDALLDVCGSLVSYDEKTSIVILSHFSVKEYLMSEFVRVKLPKYHIDCERAHLQLARSCICYMSVLLNHSLGSDGSSSDDVSSEHQTPIRPTEYLHDYVLSVALEHFQYIGSQIASILHDIKVLAEDIERNSCAWDNICLDTTGFADTTIPSWPGSRHDLPLYFLVAFAPDSLLRAYLLRPILKPKKGTNPLVYAAYFDKHEQARTLLSCGVKLNCRGWETAGSSQALPIEAAMYNCRYSMVAFFVEEGSVVSPRIFTYLLSDRENVPSSIKRMLLQTDDLVEFVNGFLKDPFRFDTFLDGIHGKDLIFFVRRMTQVHFSDPRHLDSLLHTVVGYFCEDDALEAAKLLVNHGCDPLRVEPNVSEKSLLYTAVGRTHISVVQYLISLDIQFPADMLVVTLEIWQSEPVTPIGTKAAMVHFLVENGADLRVHTEAGDSVLHVALRSFHEDDALGITELLVNCGCDPLETHSSGRSSLHIAIEQTHISVVRYLLSLGVPLPPDILVTLNPGGIWRTARVVRFLVENGANVHACTETGDSVFHVALDYSQHQDDAVDLTELLVGYGCDPLRANFSGKTPLHIAIEQTHISVVQYLLTLGIPLPPDILLVALNAQESTIEDKLSMIGFLIYSGADVQVYAETGDSVLHIVLELFSGDGALNITELLIGYGCDPLQANSDGKTPLRIAIEQGHISVAQYLLSLGVPLPPDTLFTLSPLGEWKTVQMIRFLIENGVNVYARNQAGDSALRVILESPIDQDKALAVVELLLKYGCDGNTLLQIAVERGLYLVESYLRDLGAPDEADVGT